MLDRVRGAITATGRVLVRAGDPLSKWASIIAVVGGSYWTYRLLVIEDTHEPRPQINVTAESIGYSTDSRLLLAHVTIKNMGKVRVSLKRDKFWVTIRQLPAGNPPGYIDLEKLAVMFKVTDIANYPGGYDLEPEAAYHEERAFVVPPGIYAITAEADYDEADGEEVDDTVIAKVE